MPDEEWLGVAAITVMVAAYALESRHPVFIAIFAAGCLMAAAYAYLIQSYPFLIAESLWAVVAANRWRKARRGAR